MSLRLYYSDTVDRLAACMYEYAMFVQLCLVLVAVEKTGACNSQKKPQQQKQTNKNQQTEPLAMA